ncbi:hypothetical protein QNH23_17440 [Siminovitchia fortis]|uniref:hypothetical protein n=1 Tax=Siminovitchia fortis TaxID=254758 RepID=UPI001F476EFC|nr:hypothetical protein [Siminovitchia fortis]WHY81627.1 hypothetical protein QNH23_17440 [Siminovitchia fortis]
MGYRIFENALSIHEKCNNLSYTNRLVLVAIFSGLAAVFQSAGSIFPEMGYFVSPLATAPISFVPYFQCALASYHTCFNHNGLFSTIYGNIDCAVRIEVPFARPCGINCSETISYCRNRIIFGNLQLGMGADKSPKAARLALSL